MSMTRLAPMVRLIPPEPARQRRQRGWVIGVSLLLHAVLLAALLTMRHPELDDGVAATYELRFEGTDSAVAAPESMPQGVSEAAPASVTGQPPSSTSQTDVLPGLPMPPAETPPAPDAPPLLSPPPVPEQPPPTDEPAATTTSVAPAPSDPTAPSAAPLSTTSASPTPALLPLAPLLPTQSPSTTRPQVRVEPPPSEPRPPPLVPDLVLPLPQMLPSHPLARATPSRPRPATPPAPTTGTFADPMDLNFGSGPTRLAAPRATAPRGSVASRSLDLSPGLARSSPSRADAFFDARATKLGADWEQGLMSYWLRHRYYPRQAAENGEDGTVELELTVDGSGRVQSATVKSRSGSRWIDMAAVGTWRNAQLAPLPPELTVPYTFSITINYVLLR